MDNSITFAVAMAALNVIFIPVLKFLWDQIKKSEGLAVRALDKVNRLELSIAKEYVSAVAFEKFETRLFDELETIKAKLDRKADRT